MAEVPRSSNDQSQERGAMRTTAQCAGMYHKDDPQIGDDQNRGGGGGFPITPNSSPQTRSERIHYNLTTENGSN
ncbi:unnamed protein product [Nippostrongylus brasiliensis]|uniref:Uncharacterized protein n=1 Tax=Nippostrongylus brasiliensis TaxID=27835 RepID=A0A0N4YG70_NIPBR|nr:unnamed protein product [Nippostrongylus brasiliensis]